MDVISETDLVLLQPQDTEGCVADVFISYSRRDSAFVARLQSALQKVGRAPWVDVHGVRPAEDFMRAICDAIDQAQAFVFVLSPDSVSSTICARELAHAAQSNKRLVPVVCREVEDSLVPESLRGLNWIRLAEEPAQRRSIFGGLFEPSTLELLVRQLLDAVDTDLQWVRMHTRVLRRATEWDSSGRMKDHLLRGEDLASVIAMVCDETREPKLNRLQLNYLDASKKTARSEATQPGREDLARLSGEIQAVGQMQTAGLPKAAVVFPGEQRFTLCAAREQASEVGGDLFDFYRLDGDHVLLMVGDVSGKGMAAGYFMHAVKALMKSAAMRGAYRLDEMVREVNRDAARENPSMMFVTAFIALLDVKAGELSYCLAGCEGPVLVSGSTDRAISDLQGGDGPPLCVIDDFSYQSALLHMTPGDTLYVFTDGVTEALNASGQLYGRAALKSWLHSRPKDEDIHKTCDALQEELKSFMSGAKLADDLTFLILRWNSFTADIENGRSADGSGS